MTVSAVEVARALAAELVDCLLERDFTAAQDAVELLQGQCTRAFADELKEAFRDACRERKICHRCGAPLTTRRVILNYADRPFGIGLVPEYGSEALCSGGCDGPVV